MKWNVFKYSISLRLGACAVVLITIAVALSLLLRSQFESDWIVGLVVIAVMTPVSLLLLHRQLRNYFSLFRALAGTVGSYRDSDYSFSVNWKSDPMIRFHRSVGGRVAEAGHR